jgi:hypothetical protein
MAGWQLVEQDLHKGLDKGDVSMHQVAKREMKNGAGGSQGLEAGGKLETPGGEGAEGFGGRWQPGAEGQRGRDHHDLEWTVTRTASVGLQ